MAKAAFYRLSICAAAAFVSLLVLREVRGASQTLTASRDQTAAASLIVPADGVSIPTFALNGHSLTVGDLAAKAESAFPSSAVLRRASDNRGAIGRREIRTYELADDTVTVVLEPFESRGALRVAAIYLR